MQMLATKVSKYIVYSTETQHPRRLYIFFAIAKETRSACFLFVHQEKAYCEAQKSLWAMKTIFKDAC